MNLEVYMSIKGLPWWLRGLKHLSPMRETRVRSLGWEDPLEKEMVPVFLPGESHGQRSLVGYSPRGRKESDTTKRLHSLTKSTKMLCLY